VLVVLACVVSTTMPARADQPSTPAADARFGIAEGYRDPSVMADIRAGWERVILPWDQIQPDSAGDFSHLGQTLTRALVQAELDRGAIVAGLLQFTPAWAAVNPSDGQRAVPRNLDLPFDDPENYFGQYAYQTARYYAGQIDQWIVWNEPEFKPGDAGAGGSYTWLGTDEEFAQLLKVGYLAIHKANPNAVVSFPGTSYWADVNSGRPLFYDRIMSILARDPSAPANNYYHDAVSLNLYRAADDVYRVYGLFKSIQGRYGLDKPIWLTETNAMPSNDTDIPCAAQFANSPIQTTLDQQAAYAIQAEALAAAAGYARIEFYQMVDANPCSQPAVWGVARDDGSQRPVGEALKIADENFAGYSRAQFVPLPRETAAWSAWPDDPTSLVPNWQVYQVAIDKPGNQRVTVLWNGDGSPLRARIPKDGSSAQVVDRLGNTRPLQDNAGWWAVDLSAATAYFRIDDQIKDPEGYHFIGGDPLLIVESDVDPSMPVVAPALGDPGSQPREFKVFASPSNGQTVNGGDPADFFASTRGYEGFSDPISFSILRWSTQRFPDARDASTFPLAATLPSNVTPGATATLHFETTGADPGIYYITIEADGGGQSKTFDLALAINS
jgi:hypothetical protein